jgi:hypothetical protein
MILLMYFFLEVKESREKNKKYFGWRTETDTLEVLGEILSQSPSTRYDANLNIESL